MCAVCGRWARPVMYAADYFFFYTFSIFRFYHLPMPSGIRWKAITIHVCIVSFAVAAIWAPIPSPLQSRGKGKWTSAEYTRFYRTQFIVLLWAIIHAIFWYMNFWLFRGLLWKLHNVLCVWRERQSFHSCPVLASNIKVRLLKYDSGGVVV